MIKKNVFHSTGILFLLLLAEWWLLYLSPFNIPEHIPNTQIHIGGLLLVITIIFLLIIQMKSLLTSTPAASILKLTLIGTLTVFIAEVFFQFIRQLSLDSDIQTHIYYFLLGTFGVSLFSAVIAALIAFQLKTKRTNLLLLFIVIILAGFYVVTKYLLKLEIDA
jgi:hypothetical protein